MQPTRRKLTTIFSADVQDYTRLMRADEEGTFATLKVYRDAMGRLIETHGGRIINTWGDGLIAEFASVVEALRAAIDVQNELTGYNSQRQPNSQMLFRIGLNLGDVIVEGDDIYGDGVNIAARLQATAKAGGIVISNTVYDQVRNKVAVAFDFLGQIEVKNIDGGVPSYAVRIGSPQAEEAPSQGRSEAAAPVYAGPDLLAEEPIGQKVRSRAHKMGVLGVLVLGIVAINLLTWDGELWSSWVVLAFAVLWAFSQIRSSERFNHAPAKLAVLGLGIAGINALTWSGTPWAVWPLLAIAMLAGISWFSGSRRRQ